MGAQLVITALNAHTSAHRRQHAAAIVAQLEAMFGDDEGWIEAWHSRTDPSNPARITLDKERATRWHWYTRERRPELVRLLLDWGRQYGNVYISTTLYSTLERTRASALPSRVLFVDDAPEHAPLPYSMAVETSAGNWQAYYLLAEPVDAATRQDLQRRIAYALHADKSGADPEQLGRVAGTWNTKHNKQHPVTLTYADGPRYSADKLAAHFPPVAHAPGAAALEVDDQEIAHWLGNIGQLLGPDGLPRRLKNPQGQARRVLAGELHIHNEAGEHSGSDDRACVCRGLVMHGYPDAEIAALLIHFCDYGAMARKGSAWLYEDIARLIAKERARQPHVTPTPSGAPRPHAPAVLPEAPRKSRARQDRPQRVTDDEYLAWCLATMDAGRQVKMTRREIAAAHGVSVPTVDRIEARLRARGALERFTSGDRRRSWLAVYAPPMMIVPSPESDAAAADLPPEVLSQPTGIMDRAHVGKEHTPPVGPAPAEPDPADWEQLPAVDLPKRQRPKRPRLEDLPLDAQIAELKARRRRVHHAKSRAKWIGHDAQQHALERAGEELRIRIAELEAEQIAATPPAPGRQLAIDDAPEVDAPSLSQNVTRRRPFPVQTGDPVSALQEAVQAAQDGPGAALLLEPPCRSGNPHARARRGR